jgi:hypothetical protein
MEQVSLFSPDMPASFRQSRGDALKEAAIRKITRHMSEGWRSRALACLHRLAWNAMEFSADDLREMADRAGVGAPHHVNCWAAVMNHGHRLGWMQPTGHVEKSKREEAKSRLVPIWRSRIYHGGVS